MKKIYTFFTTLFIVGSLIAQAPQSFKYQAVARDASGNIVADQAVGMQISILQGSISGTAIYIETFTPTTNGFGLINLNIGTGTVVSGDFATIDWSGDTYFVKVGMLIAGGTSYEDFGTSQLLSVPYALHAKTAANTFSGNYNDLSDAPTNLSKFTNDAGYLTSFTETDPVYSTSEAANIAATDITNLGNLSGLNTGDQDLSTLATKTALGDSSAQLRSEIPLVTSYSVGDFAQGGIVFWVDETGKNGLVCAKSDQNLSSGERWHAGTPIYTLAKGNGCYAGELNTAFIICIQGKGDNRNYAARVCNELQITENGKTYGDWYLPAKLELSLMYQNRGPINAAATANGGSAFAYTTYWSSSEGTDKYAWGQNFYNGDPIYATKETYYKLRAIRAF